MRSHALLSTLFVTLAASCFAQTPSEDALPDAPQPQPSVVATSPTPPPVTRPTAGFFTFRKSYLDPPLRSNKQVLTSKLFLIMHGMLLASLAVDKWRLPDAREHWAEEVPAVAGITALDYLMDRFFTRAYMVAPAIYGIQHYVREALQKGSK